MTVRSPPTPAQRLCVTLDRAVGQARDRIDVDGAGTRARTGSAFGAVVLARALCGWPHGPVRVCTGGSGDERPSRPTSWRHDGDRRSHEGYWVEAEDRASETTYRCGLDPSAGRSHGGTPVPWFLTAVPTTSPSTGGRRWTRTDLDRGTCPNALLLWNAVWRTRLWAETCFDVGVDDEAELDANCFDLAGHLLELLAPVWSRSGREFHDRTDCYVMRGGVRSDTHGPQETTTVRDIERGGRVHFWVEARTGTRSRPHVCDPWSRAPGSYGEPLVRYGRPGNYVPAVDGRVRIDRVERDRHWADPVI